MGYGWNFSLLNYDMVSGSIHGSRNIAMDAALQHSIAMPQLFFYPQYNFGSFTPYATGMNYMDNFLIDPRYALMQNFWGQNTSFPGGPMMQMPGFSLNPGINPSSTLTDPAEITAQKKYNKLYNIVNQLCNYNKVSDEIKAELMAARNNTTGTYEERYNRLKTAYDKVPDATVKKFLKEEGILSLTETTISGKEDTNSLYSKLTAAGYERSGTKMDETVTSVYNDINTLSEKDFTATDVESNVRALNQNQILDFLSSWNTSHSDKHFVAFIKEKAEGIEDTGNRNNVYNNVLKPVVNTLINKAQSVQENLDENSKKMLNDAIRDVEDNLSPDKDNKLKDGLSAAFDKLYALTRKAEMANLRNELIRQYGDIDSDIFKNNLFVDEVNEDLTNEKISEGTTINISQEEQAEVVAIEEGKGTSSNAGSVAENGKLLVDATDDDIETLTSGLSQENIYEFLYAYYTNNGSNFVKKIGLKLNRGEIKNICGYLVDAAKEELESNNKCITDLENLKKQETFVVENYDSYVKALYDAMKAAKENANA